MKAYLFCLHHTLPSAILMTEEGNIVASHGGSDIEDAKYWFNHFHKGDGYEVEEIDQKIIDRFFYTKDSSLEDLPEGFREAMKLNQAQLTEESSA